MILRAQSGVVQAEQQMLLVDRVNPDFMEEGNSPRTVTRDSVLDLLYLHLDTVIKSPEISEFGLTEGLQQVMNDVDHENSVFGMLKDTLLHRGFKSYGAVGDLRKSIHGVEDNDAEYDRAFMLMLRRHEKDFFLRKDIKYLGKFNNSITDFEHHLLERQATATNPEAYNKMLREVKSYQERFATIVELDERIGFDSNSGLIGQLGETHERISTALVRLENQMKAKIAEHIVTSEQVNFWVLILIIGSGVSMTIVFTRRVARSIVDFKKRIEVLAQGQFPEPFKIKGQDEISKTREVFNNFLARLRTATDFSDKIGAGELETTYDERFSDDVLAKSLLNMRNSLKVANERERRANWKNEGLRQIGNVLMEHEELDSLAQQSLTTITKYVEALAATLYLHDVDKDILLPKASYAMRLDTDTFFRPGEGIIGQCFLSADRIQTKDLPPDYMNIESGLGAASPAEVLAIPILTGDMKIGVMELASLTPFDEIAVSMIEEASKQMAVTIISRNAMQIAAQETA